MIHTFRLTSTERVALISTLDDAFTVARNELRSVIRMYDPEIPSMWRYYARKLTTARRALRAFEREAGFSARKF